jgi:N-acetyl-gamma-glutamyl-phosphate/LysW-gamma-L-alpha-aminoadipyl-6-phosphate reductase
MSLNVGVAGASGYVGGELLRLLIEHPKVEIKVATSRQYAGEYVHRIHPNLKGLTDLRFSGEAPEDVIDRVDLMFLALPHGASIKVVPRLMENGIPIIDMSADFRFKDSKRYTIWYGYEHPYPDLLKKFVYGLPELHREELRSARYVAVPGCMATAAIIGLAPLAKADMIGGTIIVDTKIGSSGAGGKPSLATHFSERFGVVRVYKPVGHRHTGEIEQELEYVSGRSYKVGMTAHAVNMVRGILATSHTFTERNISQAEVWKAYRSMYNEEPFVRFIKDKKGLYKYPDPKIVIGSNFVDVGFEIDSYAGRIVAISAIDNLVKGAAGNAIQSMNLMYGFEETEGLRKAALHPV